MDRYIGLDAHASSCTVAVIGPSGRRLASHVVATSARALVSIVDAIPKTRHLCLEEGSLAGWLHEVLTPHVQEIVVTATVEQTPDGVDVDSGDLDTRAYADAAGPGFMVLRRAAGPVIYSRRMAVRSDRRPGGS